jgi:hypothetical protein
MDGDMLSHQVKPLLEKPSALLILPTPFWVPLQSRTSDLFCTHTAGDEATTPRNQQVFLRIFILCDGVFGKFESLFVYEE